MAFFMLWVTLAFAFCHGISEADPESNTFTEEAGAQCESGECPKKGTAMLQKKVGAILTADDSSTGQCKSWCKGNANPWSTKCSPNGQKKFCGGCSDCPTPSPPATPAPPVGKCKSWCAGNKNPWSTKCSPSGQKQYCGGCSDCPTPTAARPPPPPPPRATPEPTSETILYGIPPLPYNIAEDLEDEPEDSSEDCQSWCAANTFGWAAKCNSLPACGGCSVCADVQPTASPTPAPPLGGCQSWCANNAKDWPTKCKTMTSACGACSLCPPPPTPQPTMPWEEMCTSVMNPGGEVPKGKPNILWINVDDMQWSGGGPGAQRPNFEWLAQQGVNFTRMAADSPICCPSRTSFLFGIRGGVSGYFMPRYGKPGSTGLGKGPKYYWDNTMLNSSMELMEFFRKKCYYVVGSGKINHYEREEHWPGCRDCLWDEYYAKEDFGPEAFDGKKFVPYPDMPTTMQEIANSAVDFNFAKLSEIPYKDENDPEKGWKYTGSNDAGGPRGMFNYNSPTDRDLMPDEYNADWAIDKIGEFTMKQSGQPWIIMLGLVKPHDPLQCPDEYYADFENLEDIELETGWDVVDPSANGYMNISQTDRLNGFLMYQALKESYGGADKSVKPGLQMYVQAYYACVKFVDSQAGRVLKALKTSPFWDNTIVVVLSDNGWQNGPKQYVFKNTPWETGVKVPFIMRAPGVAKEGSTCNIPVTLTDIYPTLMDLAGYAGENTLRNSSGHALTGVSIKSLLANPENENDEWDGPPAISMIYPTANAIQLPYPECNSQQECNHWSLGHKQWRYIFYSNGAEELYNIEEDVYELTNLIGTSETYIELATNLKTMLAEETGMDLGLMGKYTIPAPKEEIYSPSVFPLGYEAEDLS